MASFKEIIIDSVLGDMVLGDTLGKTVRYVPDTTTENNNLIIVTDINGQSETLTDVKGLEIIEEVNGDYSLSLTTTLTKNNYAYPLLQEESTIEYNGHEFRIKKLNENRSQKSINAQHVFFDLIDTFVYGIFGGTKSLEDFLTFALNGTGWTFTNVDVVGNVFIPNFGEDNIISLIRTVCNSFQCEVKIEANKNLSFYKELGQYNDAQFRYKHNIQTLKKSVDTSRLATVIKGYGGDGLEVEYISPNVSVFGERHATPLRDERYTIADSLLEACKCEIKDVPEITFDLEVTQINTDATLGDKVWTICEPMGIEYQSRIMAIKTFPLTKKSPVITLSNKKQEFTDILTETRITMDENRKEYRSKIEQTNERITLEVQSVNESISTINVEFGQITLEVEQLGQSISSINLDLDSINLSVEQLNTSVSSIDLELDNITLMVSALDSDLGQVESQLSIQANQISTKVSATDYTGANIVSMINQTASTIKIEAAHINLVGAVSASDITTGTMSADRISGGHIQSANWLSNSFSSPFTVYIGGLSYPSMRVYNGSLSLLNNGSEYLNISAFDTYSTYFNKSIRTPYSFYSTNGNGYGYYKYDDNSYFRIGTSTAAVVVNGTSKASWSSMPKTRLEPSGDGVLDGKEFGANNPASMQPLLTDYFCNIVVDGEKRIDMDSNFMEFVGCFDVFLNDTSTVIVKEKGVDYIVLEGTGTTSFFVMGIQKGKENIVGYSLEEKTDITGETLRDFVPREYERN
ncbi:MAG: hypothetical protein K0S34_86 [Bacillales bacterium]|nr:hypothetical protein [Bacillales bacterium]